MSVEDFLKSAYLTSQETYPQGEAIFDEGSSGDWIYVVLKGQVEIFKMAKGKRIVVDMLKEGDVFGEVSFIDKQPRSAGARAQTEVVLGVIDVDFLVSEYNKLPNHFRLIIDALARRLRKMTSVAATLAGRQTPRAAESIEVHFESKQDFFKAYSVNIGGGGIFVKTANPLEEGREVSVKFNLPGQTKPVTAQGKVAWIKQAPEQGMGVRFTKMTAEDVARLNSFIRSKVKEDD